MTGVVIRNLLAAHVDVYRALKALPNGDVAQIGIIHQFLTFDPTPAAKPVLGGLTDLFNEAFHNAIFNFLKTGIFDYNVKPTFMSVFACSGYWASGAHVYSDSLVKPGEKFLDFLGINYYSVVLTGLSGPTCNPGEYMTNMPYRAYPQGLYDRIKESSVLGVPMYVTECGISDVQDIHREDWIKTHLFAVKKAIEDGCDIRGFYYWSLLDNFEWDMGYHQHFGLYKVNFKTKERTLRKGSKVYQRIIEHQARA
jgi:beta-glucosidase